MAAWLDNKLEDTGSPHGEGRWECGRPLQYRVGAGMIDDVNHV